ncbi:MAG: T9SS type A sorting domain-containing protein [bacterium]|nr:T9SS type A sorting domain-containing protein [bacterium]
MKSLIFSLSFLSILLTTSLNAQWYQQYSGVNTNLYSFFSIDGTTAWATGANGVILKTTNKGASWIPKPSGTTYSISFVHFFNQNEGIVAGSGGTIKKSYDGGNTWQSVYGGTYNRLQEGCFVNDSVGYLCGDAGILLKTTNRGNTWTASVIGPSNFAFIYFVNETTGFATTEYTGQIWKTTDAGITWNLKQVIGSYSIWQVHFVDEYNGWVVGEFGTIAHTTNGGETWNLQYSGTGVNLRSVFFHTPDIGWVIGKDEKRLRTLNGGNNWTHDHTGYIYEYLYIYFYDNLIGWIIGTDGVILYTDNGGLPGVQNFYEKTFGGYNSERGIVMDKTNDGGIIIGGSTESFNASQDMYVIKLDSLAFIEWSKVYNSPGMIDRIHGIKQIPAGGYYLSGYIEGGYGFLDQIMMKIDASGNIIWAKNFGGQEADELRQLSITSDGGMVAAGYNASFGVGAKEVQVLKLSSNGNIEWAKTYGTPYEDFNLSIIVSSDGNFVLAGAVDITGSYGIRPTLIKMDPLGNIIWAKYYSGYNEDWGRDLVETPDGGYLIVGITTSFSVGFSNDIYLIKTDSMGNVLWAKSYGGPGEDIAYGAELTHDGKYIIVGHTTSSGFGGYDGLLMKVDSDGNLEWFRTYGGYSTDYLNDVLETQDYGFLALGKRASNTLGNDDIYLIKTDENGYSNCAFGNYSPNVITISNLQANNLTLATLSYVSAANSNLITLNPNTGENNSCAIIPVELKSFNYELESNDVLLKWSTASELNNLGFEIQKSYDGNEFISIGFIDGSGTTSEPKEYIFRDKNLEQGMYAYRLIQTDYDGSQRNIGEIEVFVNEVPSTLNLEQNFPNPFNPSTTIKFSIPEQSHIKLKVYDLLGRVVSTLVDEILDAGFYQKVFDASNLGSGIYFYSLSTDKNTITKKMLLLK